MPSSDCSVLGRVNPIMKRKRKYLKLHAVYMLVVLVARLNSLGTLYSSVFQNNNYHIHLIYYVTVYYKFLRKNQEYKNVI